ncbi:hypothetical protein [Paludisphaera mucosa]|uniref:Uncharacterized protein n=1 Tax=Paludisphaera mucosa TaxID=3030827 RepID=A0ABT6FDM0_9BACT|nr:hypothetical protein [Paludisphaera mucosa]MDG3005655.1 hypothetical protein [Paludisphaera mucosa]
MKFPRGRRAVGLAVVLAAGIAAISRLGPGPTTIAAPHEKDVEYAVEHDGEMYKVVRGAVYRVGPDPGRLTFVEALYDPDFFAENYVVVDGTPNRRDLDTGKLYPTRRHFEEGFEGAESLADLIDPSRGWTALTLQSPLAPNVADYVALRNRILGGRGGFLDNRVEVAPAQAHSGGRSLRCECVAPSPGMICAKASLSTELLHFVKGDDVWFSAWYFAAADGGRPLGLADLESTWIKEYPGMRILIDPSSGALYAELKWADKPAYRQPPGREVAFPVGRWTNVRLHLRLSERPDGRVALWQDGAKLIEAEGPTLPLANAVYNDLEVGVTAHVGRPDVAALFVDDVVISADPIP